MGLRICARPRPAGAPSTSPRNRWRLRTGRPTAANQVWGVRRWHLLAGAVLGSRPSRWRRTGWASLRRTKAPPTTSANGPTRTGATGLHPSQLHDLAAHPRDNLELSPKPLNVPPQRREQMIFSPLGARQLRLLHLLGAGDLLLGLPGGQPKLAQVHLEDLALGEPLRLGDLLAREELLLDLLPALRLGLHRSPSFSRCSRCASQICSALGMARS